MQIFLENNKYFPIFVFFFSRLTLNSSAVTFYHRHPEKSDNYLSFTSKVCAPQQVRLLIKIDLLTVYGAILVGEQTRLKLQ